MKEASECLKRATICETLAGQARDASSTRTLRELAAQWRRMANDAAGYERLASKWGGESDKTKQP